MIFQDPYSSLNSRIRIGSILAEPILFYRLAPTRRGRARRRATHRSRWSRCGFRRPVCARIFRRTKTAPLHRAGARRPSAPDRLRRADLVARRLGAGADPEPPEGFARRDGSHAAAHQPRPRGGAPDVRSHRSDEDRQARRRGRRRRPSSNRRSIPTRGNCCRSCRRSTASAARPARL